MIVDRVTIIPKATHSSKMNSNPQEPQEAPDGKRVGWRSVWQLCVVVLPFFLVVLSASSVGTTIALPNRDHWLGSPQGLLLLQAIESQQQCCKEIHNLIF
jgi:hypothetical protein